MAHSLSAKKRIRQNEKRRLINRGRQSVLKKKLRKVLDALLHKEVDNAETAFLEASRALDREADRGLIHRNQAARRKSRLARRINALKATATA
jgi:small subunit ribosomal protein S20